jgi:glycosyltransferase involved in cell wall biosynthesis
MGGSGGLGDIRAMATVGMTVAFFRYSLLNRGGDRIVLEYANHLAGLGHAVIMYVSVQDTVFFVHPNIQIIVVPWPGKLGFMLFGLLKRLPVDVVIVDIIHLPLLVGMRNRVVYFAQADDVEYYDKWAARKVMDLLYRAYFAVSPSVITVDEFLTSTFARRYGFTESYTVTNGINLESFFPDPDKELQSKKSLKTAVVLMSRGDYYRKGFDIALDVLRKIDRETGNMMELWVCGNYLDEKSFSFVVRNFGVVSDVHLRQILSSADIFFYPSRHEGFGLFPLEAMACGSVVVTTNAIPYAHRFDCILSSAREDTTGLLNSIVRLVKDKSMLNSLKANVGLAARDFDIRFSKDQFLKSLTMIVSREKNAYRH